MLSRERRADYVSLRRRAVLPQPLRKTYFLVEVWEIALNREEFIVVDRYRSRRYRKTMNQSLPSIVAAFLLATKIASAQPAPRLVTAQRVLSFGSEISKLRDFAVSNEGKIFVLDAGDSQVVVFDIEGKRLFSFGRKGHGPGEFWTPTTLRVEDTTVVVTDATNGAVRFSLNGRHIETRRSLPITLFSTKILRGDVKVETPRANSLALSAGSLDDSTSILVVRGKAFPSETLAVIRNDLGRYVVAGQPPQTRVVGVGPSAIWSVIGDSVVVVADGIRGDVKFYLVGSRAPHLVRRVELGVSARRVTAADRVAIEKHLAAGTATYRAVGGEAFSGPPLARGALDGSPAFWSVASRMLVSKNGTVWVGAQASAAMNGATQTQNTWTAIPSRGDTRRAILPDEVRIRAVLNDLLMGFAKDEEGTPIIVGYRLGATR